MQLLHIGLALLVVAIWGFNFVVIQFGLGELPPLLLAAIRFFIMSIPAVFFIKRPKIPFKRVINYGIAMFALQFGFLFAGMYSGITPGLASLLIQPQVFFSAFLGILLFNEKLHRWQVIGGLIAFGGIGYVAINLHSQSTMLGFVLVIGAGAAFGVGNAISKHLGKVDMISLVVWASLVAWPPLLGLSYFIEGADKIIYGIHHMTWVTVAVLFYLTVLSTLVAYGCWSWLIHHHPLGVIAPFTLLVPVIGMTSSALILHEPLEWWKLLATSLVILGLCINLFGPRIFRKSG